MIKSTKTKAAPKPKAPSRGILLIALGHPFYGRMAFNLAVSLKHTDPNCKIALVHNKESLTHLEAYSNHLSRYFDQMIEAPTECYTTGGEKTFIKSKVYMYDLSPFDETIFLDVDTIWLPWKRVSEAFDELKEVSWTMANRDHYDLAKEEINESYSIWCNIAEVKKVYGPGKYYSLHSEFVYFKKSKENKKYFDTAKKVFDNPRVEPARFANSIPDELPFAISCIINKHYPHKEPFLPSFWGQAERNSQLSQREIYAQYYMFSVGGNIIAQKWKDFYNSLVRWYFQEQRLQHPYQVQDKKLILKDRANV